MPNSRPTSRHSSQKRHEESESESESEEDSEEESSEEERPPSRQARPRVVERLAPPTSSRPASRQNAVDSIRRLRIDPSGSGLELPRPPIGSSSHLPDRRVSTASTSYRDGKRTSYLVSETTTQHTGASRPQGSRLVSRVSSPVRESNHRHDFQLSGRTRGEETRSPGPTRGEDRLHPSQATTRRSDDRRLEPIRHPSRPTTPGYPTRTVDTAERLRQVEHELSLRRAEAAALSRVQRRAESLTTWMTDMLNTSHAHSKSAKLALKRQWHNDPKLRLKIGSHCRWKDWFTDEWFAESVNEVAGKMERAFTARVTETFSKYIREQRDDLPESRVTVQTDYAHGKAPKDRAPGYWIEPKITLGIVGGVDTVKHHVWFDESQR